MLFIAAFFLMIGTALAQTKVKMSPLLAHLSW